METEKLFNKKLNADYYSYHPPLKPKQRNLSEKLPPIHISFSNFQLNLPSSVNNLSSSPESISGSIKSMGKAISLKNLKSSDSLKELSQSLAKVTSKSKNRSITKSQIAGDKHLKLIEVVNPSKISMSIAKDQTNKDIYRRKKFQQQFRNPIPKISLDFKISNIRLKQNPSPTVSKYSSAHGAEGNFSLVMSKVKPTKPPGQNFLTDSHDNEKEKIDLRNQTATNILTKANSELLLDYGIVKKRTISDSKAKLAIKHFEFPQNLRNDVLPNGKENAFSETPLLFVKKERESENIFQVKSTPLLMGYSKKNLHPTYSNTRKEPERKIPLPLNPLKIQGVSGSEIDRLHNHIILEETAAAERDSIKSSIPTLNSPKNQTEPATYNLIESIEVSNGKESPVDFVKKKEAPQKVATETVNSVVTVISEIISSEPTEAKGNTENSDHNKDEKNSNIAMSLVTLRIPAHKLESNIITPATTTATTTTDNQQKVSTSEQIPTSMNLSSNERDSKSLVLDNQSPTNELGSLIGKDSELNDKTQKNEEDKSNEVDQSNETAQRTETAKNEEVIKSNQKAENNEAVNNDEKTENNEAAKISEIAKSNEETQNDEQTQNSEESKSQTASDNSPKITRKLLPFSAPSLKKSKFYLEHKQSRVFRSEDMGEISSTVEDMQDTSIVVQSTLELPEENEDTGAPFKSLYSGL